MAIIPENQHALGQNVLSMLLFRNAHLNTRQAIIGLVASRLYDNL